MPTDNVAAARDDLVRCLESWRKWYERSKNFYGFVWNLFTISTIVISALTSILVAANFGSDAQSWQRLILIALPAIASLLSTLLVQFRIRESWQLRESGRLDLEELIVKARALPVDDEAKFRESDAAIRLAALAVDRGQASQFFAYLAQKPDRDREDSSKLSRRDK